SATTNPLALISTSEPKYDSIAAAADCARIMRLLADTKACDCVPAVTRACLPLFPAGSKPCRHIWLSIRCKSRQHGACRETAQDPADQTQGPSPPDPVAASR